MKLLYTLFKISFFVGCFVCLFQDETQGQQTSFMSTYLYEPAFYNPAALNNGHVALLYKRQWTAFDSDIAPTSFMLNGDLSNLLSFSNKVGLGLTLKTDKAHIFKRTNVDFSFAYHLYKEEGRRFSLGLIAGLLNQRVDFRDINISKPDDVSLYSGNANQIIFDGGPGLFYTDKKNNNELSISVAFPQLFTSDLNYEELGQTFDNRLHVLAGLSYKMELEAISVEPSVLFNGVNGSEDLFAKRTCDITSRVFFLDSKFWISGGIRLNGNTFLSGAGVNINEKLNILGLYERHNKLGSSFEVAFSYGFQKKVQGPEISTIILNEFEKEKARLENADEKLSLNRFFDLKQSIASARDVYEEAKDAGLTKTELTAKVKEIERYMGMAKEQLDNLLRDVQPAYTSVWNFGRIVAQSKEAETFNQGVRSLNKSIEEDGEALEAKVEKANQEYLSLNTEILNLKLQKGIDEPIGDLIRGKDILNLNKRLKSELESVPGTGFNAKVEVQKEENMKIVYSFPYIENPYTIRSRINKRTIIMDHIITQLNQLKVAQVEIESIYLKMLLQDELEDMKATKSVHPYLGEFGEVALMSLTYIDTENEKRESLPLKIFKGQATSISDLAALKIKGIHRYFLERGMSTMIPVYNEITGPNYDKESSETFVLEIVLKQ